MVGGIRVIYLDHLEGVHVDVGAMVRLLESIGAVRVSAVGVLHEAMALAAHK